MQNYSIYRAFETFWVNQHGEFQMNHPDLAVNYYVNRFDIAGYGQDDDGNGYVDDVSGLDVFADDLTLPSDHLGTYFSSLGN
jgi:hypothetical protein